MSNSSRVRAALLVVGGLVIAASACARRSRPSPKPTASAPKPGIYHVPSGERLSLSELAKRLETARFVVFGEQHPSEWQHRKQADLFRALTNRESEFALGMEMFQRPFQEALDAYVAGEIDESSMLEQTEWEARWGVDSSLYRPLWRRAKSKGLPVIALNLRRELSKKIARVGLDGLDEGERRRLPAHIDTSISAQREYVRRAFEQHGMSEHMEFEHFLEAQAAWDETMAETAIEALRRRDDVGRMFIAAGRAHARSDFGIPRRLERRLDSSEPRDRVVSVIPYLRSEVRPEELRSRGEADYVWLKRSPEG